MAESFQCSCRYYKTDTCKLLKNEQWAKMEQKVFKYLNVNLSLLLL